MRIYIIRNKKTNEVFGRFKSKDCASASLLEYIQEKNKDIDSNLLVFDYDIQEVEYQEINSYEEAKNYLGLSDEPLMTICGVNKHHEKNLLALSKLFTIAEAWNKEDGFVPDYSNEKQSKYFPLFVYNKHTACFTCTYPQWATGTAYANCGFRLCFATRERAFDFGKKFQDLYNDFLMIK